MWESFIKCGQNIENVGNVGPLGTLLIIYYNVLMYKSAAREISGLTKYNYKEG